MMNSVEGKELIPAPPKLSVNTVGPDALIQTGIFDDIRSEAEEWTLPGWNPRLILLRLMSRARKSIHFVVGELDPQFFEKMDLLGMLDHKLRHGLDVQIVSGMMGVATGQEAEESLRSNNQGMVSLKQEFGSKLRIFWARKVPRLHYYVIDSAHVMNEEPDHAPHFPPATITRYNDKKWAREWEEQFREQTRLSEAELMGGVT